MRHVRGSLLLASFLASAPLLAVTALPAHAQFSASISFDSFHGTLAGYGDWLYSDRWGEVWRPLSQDRDSEWRPYWAGHWVPTREYGWTWISDEGEWGDIAYHYGRWVYDPDDGWLWLPGYVWSPAWVVWRSSGPDLGWMPMPPDNAFLGPSFSISIGFGDWNDIGGYYGYSRWYGSRFDQRQFSRLWVFVPGDRITDPGFRRYALPQPQTINIIQNSRNITNYTVVNNVIVNRSVSAAAVPQVRAAQPVPANTVLRNTRLVTPVNQGEQIQNRARQERPHGTGEVGSAPPPTPQVIRTLSPRPVPVKANTQTNAGGAPGGANAGRGGEHHVFSQANAQELQARARGGQQQPGAAPNAQQPGAPQPGAQPNAQRPGAAPNAQPGPQNGPANAEPDRNRDNGRDNNGRNERGRGPERQPNPAANPPPNAPEAARPPEAGRATPPENPPTEDRRGRGAERAPRTLPGQQPAAPPPAMEQQRPRDVLEPSAPREQPQRDQRQAEPRAMEQRMPPPERAAPPPERAAPREMAPPREAPPPREQQRQMPPQREIAPPREQAPPREAAPPREQAQPREQAPPREQARPNNPPPDRGRAQDRGRGNDRDRPDDNSR